MKMEPIVSSETSAVRTQTPGNCPKRNKLHLECNLLYIYWDPLCFSVGVSYNKCSHHIRIMLCLHFLTCLFFIVHSPSLNSCKNVNRHWGMYFTFCGQGLIWVLSWHLPEGTEEEHKSTWVRITSLWAEIWTWDLLNAKLECCVLEHMVNGSELSSIHNCEV